MSSASASGLSQMASLLQRNKPNPRSAASKLPRASGTHSRDDPDADFITRIGLAKHRVMVKVIPWTLLCIGIRVALALSPLEFIGVFATDTITPFTTASMFVIAIVLDGVLEDYKEAEQIPAQIVGAFDALSSKVQFIELSTQRAKAREEAKAKEAHGEKKGEKEEEEIEVMNSLEVHAQMFSMLETILEFFGGMRSEQDISAVINTYAAWFALKVQDCAEASSIEAWEVFEIFDGLREAITRMSVIKRTNFMSSGQTLMRSLVGITVVLVTFGRFENGNAPEVPAGEGGRRLSVLRENPAPDAATQSDDWFASHMAAYVNIGAYVFLFVFTLFLIEDIDDPFEYNEYDLLPHASSVDNDFGEINASHSGSADIDPFPLLELYVRLASLAGHSDVTDTEQHGLVIGMRPNYNLAKRSHHQHEQEDEFFRTPCQAVIDAENSHDAPHLVARREKYRRLLQDATAKVLRTLRSKHEEKVGGSSSTRKASSKSVNNSVSVPLIGAN